MGNIRVLVVDDSAFMRKVISDILSQDPFIEVIDRARNGQECLDKAASLKPDVITLDVEMPVMNGLEALEQLMKTVPTPVVMVSSLTREGADATIKALELGAVDFVTKPSGPISLDIHAVAHLMVEKVKAAAQAKRYVKRVAVEEGPTVQTTHPAAVFTKGERRSKTGPPATDKLVAIGTSTGGPKALQKVLTDLPATFEPPIVIVQHMPPGFTKSLAQRLDSLCQIRVVEAEDGQLLETGTAYIAPGGYHLEVIQRADGKLYTHLHQAEPRGGHRPSVDVMFESISTIKQVQKWAVIMTGMGSDGTKGLKLMKESGLVTSVIEDESTCVVYGMPRAAVQAGLADHVVPLDQIAKTLIRLVN